MAAAADAAQAAAGGSGSSAGRRATCPKCGGKLLETEERRRQTKSGFPTRKDAQAAMNKILVAVEEQSYIAPRPSSLCAST